MLNINADELDLLRVKLLASVACDGWPEAPGSLAEDARQHALEAAEHLERLSAHLLQSGHSYVYVDSSLIASALLSLVNSRQAA